MVSTVKFVLFGVLFLMAGMYVSANNSQRVTGSTKAVQLTGLIGVKSNTEGILTIENGNLRFTHSKSVSDLTAGSMQDVITGRDSQRVIRGTAGTLSMFAPYESGRFLSLFRSKLDTLTIQFRDIDGGLHGVIFTMPVGAADGIKDKLVALGANTSIPTQGEPITESPDPTKTPLNHAQGGRPGKINASAIRVMMIQSDEIKLPAEFQVSLYENLIKELQKKGGLYRIYREGDRNSADASTLIVLRSRVRGFKQGSERARQVTTISGATSISVHCEFTDKDGHLLLARDIKGKVRFFGGNLKATYDFAKTAANVTHENFFQVAGT
jgi:hypothetical protein